jgi:tetratricopeptide (TPR) repeat protein
MFLLQYTILACLLTAVQPFATKYIASDQKRTKVNGVRVHYLRTILLREVRDAAGIEEDTAIVKGDHHTITANTTAESSSTDLEYASLCDIAAFLELDDLHDALQILNQGLAINEKVYGKEHLATAACYNNIGAVMKAMGDDLDALDMLYQGLATFEKAYGKEHPATATSYTNIGSVMQATGNNAGALEMYNEGLAIREKVLGKEHPDTAESYNNIGLLYDAMGNNAGALEMLDRGLALHERVYTPVSSHLRVRRT